MKDEVILDVAKNLFTSYGFKKVSMDEIAIEAGVTKKTVYSYFPSKEELLKSIIKQELSNMRELIENVEKESDDFFENVHKGICQLLKYRSKSKFFSILIRESEMLNNDILKDNLKIVDKEIKDYIQLKIQKAVDNKKIIVQNIEIMTYLIYKMYIALIIEWNESNEKLSEKDIADNILQILKNGLERKEVE